MKNKIIFFVVFILFLVICIKLNHDLSVVRSNSEKVLLINQSLINDISMVSKSDNYIYDINPSKYESKLLIVKDDPINYQYDLVYLDSIEASYGFMSEKNIQELGEETRLDSGEILSNYKVICNYKFKSSDLGDFVIFLKELVKSERFITVESFEYNNLKDDIDIIINYNFYIYYM